MFCRDGQTSRVVLALKLSANASISEYLPLCRLTCSFRLYLTRTFKCQNSKPLYEICVFSKPQSQAKSISLPNTLVPVIFTTRCQQRAPHPTLTPDPDPCRSEAAPVQRMPVYIDALKTRRAWVWWNKSLYHVQNNPLTAERTLPGCNPAMLCVMMARDGFPGGEGVCALLLFTNRWPRNRNSPTLRNMEVTCSSTERLEAARN